MQKWIVALVALLVVPVQCFGVTVTLHGSNVGISSLAVNIVGTDIGITEVWSSNGPGYLLFSDLVPGTDYTVTKSITNNTGTSWIRLANELLDPLGQAEDAADPLPYPAFVPLDFSTSNDNDGLSFAQGSGILRVSSIFPSVLVDEASDARDFLDFFGATWADGATGTISFGLRENFNTQQPFLLIERPNAFSRPEIPEPASVFLLGSGLATLFVVRRRRNASR